MLKLQQNLVIMLYDLGITECLQAFEFMKLL